MQSKTKQEHKAILSLAIPMILSNITVPLLGLADTAVIGHLPEAYYLGGSAVGAMLIGLIIWFCGFLRMSTSGLTAQAVGREDSQQNIAILLNGTFVAVGIALCCLLFSKPLISLGLLLTGGSAEIQFYTEQYCQIRVWGYPASLITVVLLGWLLGNKQAKSVMWLLIITNLINIILDVLFVVYFKWQVAGIAWATVIAEYIGLSYGLWCAMKITPWQDIKNYIQRPLSALLHQAKLAQYFNINRDILIRTLCLQAAFTFMTIQGVKMGDVVVAANAILMNFLLLISFGLDGIANAAEVRVGETYGKKDKEGFLRAIRVSTFWTVMFALLYSLLFILFGEHLIRLISSIQSVNHYALDYLFWIQMLPIIACGCFLLDGIYIGLTKAKAMRNAMIISTFAVFFPAWFLLQGYENHGLWAAFTIFMAMRGVTLLWHFYYHLALDTIKPHH